MLVPQTMSRCFLVLKAMVLRCFEDPHMSTKICGNRRPPPRSRSLKRRKDVSSISAAISAWQTRSVSKYFWTLHAVIYIYISIYFYIFLSYMVCYSTFIVFYCYLYWSKNQHKTYTWNPLGPCSTLRHVGQQRAAGGTGRRPHSGTGGGISCNSSVGFLVGGWPTPLKNMS
jgi:hypothetical protein